MIIVNYQLSQIYSVYNKTQSKYQQFTKINNLIQNLIKTKYQIQQKYKNNQTNQKIKGYILRSQYIHLSLNQKYILKQFDNQIYSQIKICTFIKMQDSIIKVQRKTQLSVAQKQETKQKMYILRQWLETQYTYKQDIEAAINIIQPQLLKLKLLDQAKLNKLFPYFKAILDLSQNMIAILSKYQTTAINKLLIGAELNKIVGFYKIYLQYFKNKSQMQNMYFEIQKNNPKQIRLIQNQLREYFQKFYQNKTISEGKEKSQAKNPKVNITIHDCIEKPLYRIFKYNLFIDRYIKKLSQNHPDYTQLKKTRSLFQQIGDKCNNSFTQQQKQDFKVKLQKLYGRSLPQTSHYKVMMSADTLYFPCKLYIFSNLIIISKAEKLIGFRQEKLYSNLGIDEFSFITYKNDIKYFKNILLLCGIYDCIHFFLPDKGTRLQIYQLINKMIHQEKMNCFRKRQHRQVKATNTLFFLLDKNKKQDRSYLTGLKVEVVDIDMRELNILSSDTVFILRISIPQYIDDQATFLKNSYISVTSQIHDKQKKQRQSMTKQEHIMTSKIGPVSYKKFQTDSQFVKSSNYCPINQYMEIHLSEIINIHKKLSQSYSQINFPEIDPFSKDFNFYSESKKKTRSFQVRAFLIQQFFNYVFRHPSIMNNPLTVLAELKLNESIWDYAVDRSYYLQNQNRDEHLPENRTPGNKYDQNHCQLCSMSVINKISKFESIRATKIRQNSTRPQNYCFNSYNLLRNNLLGLPFGEFDTLERMLLYSQYFQGRLDYCFLYKKNLAKKYKVIEILIPKLILPNERSAEQKNIFRNACEISIDHKTTVGMIINSISNDIEINNMFDYRLVIEFNEQQRVLDQDQSIFSVIDKYQLPFQEKAFSESDTQIIGPRNSIRQESFIKSTMGFFSMFKNMLPVINKTQSVLYLKKMVYFPLYFEIQSIKSNIEKSKLVLAEILQKISKLNSASISLQIWAEISGLYYCLLSIKDLNRISMNNKISDCCKDILPSEKQQLSKNKIFSDKMTTVVNQTKKLLSNSNQQQHIFIINKRIMSIGYKYFKINTYFVGVSAKSIPYNIILDNISILNGNCMIGVNNNEIIVIRDKINLNQVIRMPLQDVQIVHSVYSLFLKYKRQNFDEQNGSTFEQFELRFDNKMLHGFVQLCEKYKLIKSKFSSILIQN